jgi:hypothetical protein
MKAEKLGLIRGSGNVFRDLSRENADVEQLKTLLAAEIIKALDRDKLTSGPHTPEPASPRPTSHASATPISPGSPLIDLYQFSTVSDRVSR